MAIKPKPTKSPAVTPENSPTSRKKGNQSNKSPAATLGNNSEKTDNESESPLSKPACPTFNRTPNTNLCRSLLQTTVDKTPGTSPSSKEMKTTGSDTDTGAETDGDSNKPKKPWLKKCPCGISSGGQAWVLKCTSCTQTWHNTCANMKGPLPQSFIEHLDLWQCPWCYVCPFQPPKHHKSLKANDKLASTVMMDSIVCKIEETIKTCLKPHNDDLVAMIQSGLNKFTSDIKQVSSQQTCAPLNNQPPPINPIVSVEHKPANTEILEPPFSKYETEFIDENYAQDIKAFLSKETFVKEGKREVASYGTKYKYMGAKNTTPKPIPNVLQPLLDKLNNGQSNQLNQILINRYTGPESFLPRHSDNEFDIDPASSIFTISIGDTATIKFTAKNAGKQSDLEVEDRSMYSMTRSSQNIYSHQIDANTSNSIRYSLTVRCVHWTFLNSLITIGDSNFGHLKFGDGKGKIGKSTPGTNKWAPKVEDINPVDSMSYKNIMTMCGTNDLKGSDVNVLDT